MCKTCRHRFDCNSNEGGCPCYQVDIDAYRKVVRKQTVEDIIKFIEKWRDRQIKGLLPINEKLTKRIVRDYKLIATEIIGTIKIEFLESEDK